MWPYLVHGVQPPGAHSIERSTGVFRMSSQGQHQLVSRKHAEMALVEAVFRMNSALGYLESAESQPDDLGDECVNQIVIESAITAAGVAMELLTDLGISRPDPDSDLVHRDCFSDWEQCLARTGPFLVISDARG